MTTGARTLLESRQQSGGMFVADDLQDHPGEIFFVNSVTGTNSASRGKSPDTALATIDYAVGLCTANQGDTIYVMPGHAEAVVAANGIDVDVAGVSVIGLGRGTLKPTVTLGTATTATVRVAAANVLIRNIRFVSNINDLALILSLAADYGTVEDCEFVSSAAKEYFCGVALTTTKDHFEFRRCTWEQPTDPAGTDGGAVTGAIYLVDTEHVLVEDCAFLGNFETAFIHNLTTACKHLYVKNCHGRQELSGAEPFQLVDGAHGAMLGGGFITPAEAAATEATLVGTIGASFAVLQPAAFFNDGAAGGGGGIIIATAS